MDSPAENSAHRAPLVAPSVPQDGWDLLVKVLIIVGLAFLLWLNDELNAFDPLLELAHRHGLSELLVRPSIMWAVMGTLLMAFRTILWFRYRPYRAATLSDAPTMTVIIPAYNEGAMVHRAIDSVAAARYPADRLEILVVDDGSTDDTWTHICHAVATHGGRVRATRLPRNAGKREALAVGFREGNGEIFVTVDSDSVVEPGALLALAGPFKDERIGVVAGRVLVLNREEGLIPRMLNVRFLLAFDFLRAYQSTIGTVYCSPGALSGYRASAVKRVLEPWLGQRFLGAQATIGEDRALTNDVMALGFDSVYQRDAAVFTMVPTTYRQLCRMFLRWDRSYIREELRFARIVWRRPLRARLIALADTTITNLRYPVLYAVLVLLAISAVEDPLAIARMLVMVGVVGFIYALYALRSDRSWEFLYSVLFSYFQFLAMTWIFPFALLTVRARGWLTR